MEAPAGTYPMWGRPVEEAAWAQAEDAGGVPNVLVVDGACWPSSGWQSPTLTMMAITRRACLAAVMPGND